MMAASTAWKGEAGQERNWAAPDVGISLAGLLSQRGIDLSHRLLDVSDHALSLSIQPHLIPGADLSISFLRRGSQRGRGPAFVADP